MTVATATYIVPDQRAYRLKSIDMLRGLVILIMTLDHVRDFFMAGAAHGVPMSDPNISPLLFMTRWITNFAAPVFVFLAGTSAGLMTTRKSPSSLANFLVKRGVWIIFVEITVISTAFTFSPFGAGQAGGHTLLILQVLWGIGASMIVLAGAQFLGTRACFVIGAAIILSHNLLDAVWPESVAWPKNGVFDMGLPLWVSLHAPMMYVAGRFQIFLVYPLLPWVGVMLLGYGSSGIFQHEPRKQESQLFRIGVALSVAFLMMRALDLYGDPNRWHSQPSGVTATVMSFLNTTKYPPSLLYLLMTLGPAALVCSYADRFNGWFKDTLVMFGRVPFVFYVAHLYLAHALAVALGLCQGFTISQMWTYYRFNPKGFGVSLPEVYVMWLLIILLLYPLCRWVGAVKAQRKDWWLSYL